MRHRDSNASYSIHTMFSCEELSSIKLQEIVAWMKLTVLMWGMMMFQHAGDQTHLRSTR